MLPSEASPAKGEHSQLRTGGGFTVELVEIDMSSISAWAIAASDQDFGRMGKHADGPNGSFILQLRRCLNMLEHQTLPIDSPRFHIFSFAVTKHSARCPSIAAPQVLYTPQLPRTAPCSRCRTLQNAKQSELSTCLVPTAWKSSGLKWLKYFEMLLVEPPVTYCSDKPLWSLWPSQHCWMWLVRRELSTNACLFSTCHCAINVQAVQATKQMNSWI